MSIVLKRDNVEKIVKTEAEAEKLLGAGFKKVETKAPKKSDQKQTPPNSGEKALDEKNVDELKAVAKEKGITGYASLNKAQLLEVLKGGE